MVEMERLNRFASQLEGCRLPVGMVVWGEQRGFPISLLVSGREGESGRFRTDGVNGWSARCLWLLTALRRHSSPSTHTCLRGFFAQV